MYMHPFLLVWLLLQNVFGFLHPTDQLLSRLTCKAWRQVAGVPVQVVGAPPSQATIFAQGCMHTLAHTSDLT